MQLQSSWGVNVYSSWATLAWGEAPSICALCYSSLWVGALLTEGWSNSVHMEPGRSRTSSIHSYSLVITSQFGEGRKESLLSLRWALGKLLSRVQCLFLHWRESHLTRARSNELLTVPECLWPFNHSSSRVEEGQGQRWQNRKPLKCMHLSGGGAWVFRNAFLGPRRSHSYPGCPVSKPKLRWLFVSL